MLGIERVLRELIMLEFKHEWKPSVNPNDDDPALYVHCIYCKAVVEVLMVEAHGQTFLRGRLVGEGGHPVSDEEIDEITKAVYARYVAPSLASQPGGES